jgi:hypothetical protein
VFQKNDERVYDVRSDYYVYHLINPLSGSPFYIGKGKNGGAINILAPGTIIRTIRGLVDILGILELLELSPLLLRYVRE